MDNCKGEPIPLLLREAIESRNYTFLRSYLSCGFDTYAQEDNEYTSLQIALEVDDIEVVRFLLEHKVDPDECYLKGIWTGYTPLQYALINRSTAMALLLIEYGADIFSVAPDQTQPIVIALKYERIRVVRYLVDNRINSDSLINDELSFLSCATIMENVKIIKCILKHRPNVNLNLHRRAIVAATNAFSTRASRLVKMLYKYGFTLQPTDVDITLVQTAIKKGLYDVVLNLLKLGVNPNMAMITDKEQAITGSLLHIAVVFGKLRIVQLLLEYGANIHLRNSNGKTPILIAAHTNNLAIIRFLLKHGANVKDSDSDNNTVLHCVIEENMDYVYGKFDWNLNRAKTKLVNLLISKGADINAKTRITSNSPLHLAARIGVPGAVQVLLSHGARVDEVNSMDLTPLMVAQDQMTHLITNQLESLPCSELKLCTFQLLQHHVYRLHRIGLSVCPRDLVASNDEKFELKDDVSKIIDNEIEFIKGTRIANSSITLHRFLTSTNKEAAVFVQNDDLLKNLKAMLYRPCKFPEYAKLIRNKLTIALKKKELNKVTFKLINFFFKGKKLPSLPDECIENIISFLSDKDKELVIAQFAKHINIICMETYKYLNDHVSSF